MFDSNIAVCHKSASTSTAIPIRVMFIVSFLQMILFCHLPPNINISKEKLSSIYGFKRSTGGSDVSASNECVSGEDPTQNFNNCAALITLAKRSLLVVWEGSAAMSISKSGETEECFSCG